jgi:hypothetical protein
VSPELVAAVGDMASRFGFDATRRCLLILESKLETELHSSGSEWEGDDGTEPPIILTVSNRRGIVDARIDPAWLRARRLSIARGDSSRDFAPTRHRQREPRRRNVRTSARRTRAPAASKADDDPPLPDVAQVARASVRCWARVKRREARQRIAA